MFFFYGHRTPHSALALHVFGTAGLLPFNSKRLIHWGALSTPRRRQLILQHTGIAVAFICWNFYCFPAKEQQLQMTNSAYSREHELRPLISNFFF